MQNRRSHYFPANDCRVITGLVPVGGYAAHREDDELVRGRGPTRYSAIADLVAKLEAADDLPEDHRTPFSAQDQIDWEHDRARSIQAAE